MREQPDHNHTAARQDADRCQARYFSLQLGYQIDLLNERAEEFKTALAICVRRGDQWQARRIQHEVRLCAVERRRLLDMLRALDDRFPPEDPEPQPASGKRHLTVAPG